MAALYPNLARAVVAGGCIAIIACAGITHDDTSWTKLTISPSAAQVNVGESVKLSAIGDARALKVVSWWSDDPAIATVIDGRVTGVASGTTTVHALSGATYDLPASQKRDGTATITVNRPAAAHAFDEHSWTALNPERR